MISVRVGFINDLKTKRYVLQRKINKWIMALQDDAKNGMKTNEYCTTYK